MGNFSDKLMCYLFIFMFLLLFVILTNGYARKVLISYYTRNGDIDTDHYLGSIEWSRMTSALENGGENQIIFTENFEDLNYVIQFDAIWAQIRDISDS